MKLTIEEFKTFAIELSEHIIEKPKLYPKNINMNDQNE